MKISYNLATNLAGIIHITDKDNNILEANIDIKENGFDPVDSATMNVKCDTDKPFTIHVLFPEIVSDELPGLIELNCKVLSEKTHLVIDATDVAGKCTALPFYKFGKWCQGSNKISMDKEYMHD